MAVKKAASKVVSKVKTPAKPQTFSEKVQALLRSHYPSENYEAVCESDTQYTCDTLEYGRVTIGLTGDNKVVHSSQRDPVPKVA